MPLSVSVAGLRFFQMALSVSATCLRYEIFLHFVCIFVCILSACLKCYYVRVCGVSADMMQTPVVCGQGCLCPFNSACRYLHRYFIPKKTKKPLNITGIFFWRRMKTEFEQCFEIFSQKYSLYFFIQFLWQNSDLARLLEIIYKWRLLLVIAFICNKKQLS